jgi:hypothetical protein
LFDQNATIIAALTTERNTLRRTLADLGTTQKRKRVKPAPNSRFVDRDTIIATQLIAENERTQEMARSAPTGLKLRLKLN